MKLSRMENGSLFLNLKISYDSKEPNRISISDGTYSYYYFFPKGKSLKLNDLVYCIKKMIKSQYTPPF